MRRGTADGSPRGRRARAAVAVREGGFALTVTKVSGVPQVQVVAVLRGTASAGKKIKTQSQHFLYHDRMKEDALYPWSQPTLRVPTWSLVLLPAAATIQRESPDRD
jgi:hypothetical protein